MYCLSVVSYHQSAWISCHTVSNWMALYQCGFFHVLSSHCLAQISCHTLCNQIVHHQHGFSYAVSINQTVRISYHTVGTWKVLHHEFFHVPSNHEEVGISWHALNSYMVVQQDYAFLHWWKRKWLLLFFQECHTTFDVQMPNMDWEMPKITGFYTRNHSVLH